MTIAPVIYDNDANVIAPPLQNGAAIGRPSTLCW